mmetsp:Transcript_29139/g.67592  ORF Transcript_29139/g.67592 Transcript_29139/m.67592 type:complete len:224 (+) Transcript_29139:1692-2363(+)
MSPHFTRPWSACSKPHYSVSQLWSNRYYLCWRAVSCNGSVSPSQIYTTRRGLCRQLQDCATALSCDCWKLASTLRRCSLLHRQPHLLPLLLSTSPLRVGQLFSWDSHQSLGCWKHLRLRCCPSCCSHCCCCRSRRCQQIKTKKPTACLRWSWCSTSIVPPNSYLVTSPWPSGGTLATPPCGPSLRPTPRSPCISHLEVQLCSTLLVGSRTKHCCHSHSTWRGC